MMLQDAILFELLEALRLIIESSNSDESLIAIENAKYVLSQLASTVELN